MPLPIPMNSRRYLPFLFLAAIACPAAETPPPAATENPPAPTEKKQASEEEIKARLADHLARKYAKNEATKKESAKRESQSQVPPPAASAPATSAKSDAKTPAAEEPATVLPRVEVRKDRITELDRQLAKQDREIAAEKQNTKPTALDETLNGPKVSKFFSIFGGQSSDDRANIARERVAMMEEEKDMLEAISQAQTKEEKAELQKTLDSMRAMRRELEAALR